MCYCQPERASHLLVLTYPVLQLFAEAVWLDQVASIGPKAEQRKRDDLLFFTSFDGAVVYEGRNFDSK
jgi:hypothetical protein